MIRQRDKNSCVVANTEAIIKFFEPQSQWNQERFWEELVKRQLPQPSFGYIKTILECDELSAKYAFCVSYANPTELPDVLRSWLTRKTPVAFSYEIETPQGLRVHCNTALHEDRDVFAIFDPGYVVSMNEWTAEIVKMTAEELKQMVKNRRDLFTMSARVHSEA